MAERERRPEGFDGSAAVTRALLGWGLVAGVFYLTVGIVLASTREGFDLAAHPLSLLMLGDGGWMQRTNLIVSGCMTVAAGLGMRRALRDVARGRRSGALVLIYGMAVVASGIFPPDPMAGFPDGAAGDHASVSGVLHLAFGAVGFLAVAAAAFALAGWFAERQLRAMARWSRVCGAIILLGFLAGAALAELTVGVGALWLAVIAGWAWLATTCVHLYRWVPHPDPDRRTSADAAA